IKVHATSKIYNLYLHDALPISVPVHSKLYFIEIKSKVPAKVKIGNELFGESALYILEGSINDDGNLYEPRQILIANDTKLCELRSEEHTSELQSRENLVCRLLL